MSESSEKGEKASVRYTLHKHVKLVRGCLG